VNPNEMQEMLKKAQEMQSKMGELQAELGRRRFEASAGGGMVTAIVSGALRVVSIEVEPVMIEHKDRDMIQDLTAAAVNAALTKAQDAVSQEMTRFQSSMLAGLPNLPGMPGLTGRPEGGS